jgi:hypothetical protein
MSEANADSKRIAELRSNAKASKYVISDEKRDRIESFQRKGFKQKLYTVKGAVQVVICPDPDRSCEFEISEWAKSKLKKMKYPFDESILLEPQRCNFGLVTLALKEIEMLKNGTTPDGRIDAYDSRVQVVSVPLVIYKYNLWRIWSTMDAETVDLSEEFLQFNTTAIAKRKYELNILEVLREDSTDIEKLEAIQQFITDQNSGTLDGNSDCWHTGHDGGDFWYGGGGRGRSRGSNGGNGGNGGGGGGSGGRGRGHGRGRGRGRGGNGGNGGRGRGRGRGGNGGNGGRGRGDRGGRDRSDRGGRGGNGGGGGDGGSVDGDRGRGRGRGRGGNGGSVDGGRGWDNPNNDLNSW